MMQRFPNCQTWTSGELLIMKGGNHGITGWQLKLALEYMLCFGLQFSVGLFHLVMANFNMGLLIPLRKALLWSQFVLAWVLRISNFGSSAHWLKFSPFRNVFFAAMIDDARFCECGPLTTVTQLIKTLDRCAQLLITNISWLLTNTQILGSNRRAYKSTHFPASRSIKMNPRIVQV